MLFSSRKKEENSVVGKRRKLYQNHVENRGLDKEIWSLARNLAIPKSWAPSAWEPPNPKERACHLQPQWRSFLQRLCLRSSGAAEEYNFNHWFKLIQTVVALVAYPYFPWHFCIITSLHYWAIVLPPISKLFSLSIHASGIQRLQFTLTLWE